MSTTSTRYEWSNRFRNKGVGPQEAYDELELIKEANDGKLKPQDIVDRSRDKKAVLHPIFELNSKRAAYLYRCEQARNIVRSIKQVNVETGKPERVYETVTVKSMEPESESDEKAAYHVEEIMERPTARDELLIQAIKESLSYKRRFGHLQELAKVFAAMDEVIKKAGNG